MPATMLALLLLLLSLLPGPCAVLPLDTTLRTLPVGFYGSFWGVRPPELIEKMSKMTLLILMQNDGTCWRKCCPNAGVNGSACAPLHDASVLPGCDPSCDQHGGQMATFAAVKAQAARGGRRPPHCMMYLNAVYLWPFDRADSLGEGVRLLDTKGQPHMENNESCSRRTSSRRRTR